ncbi:unnamed protein product [Clonostachys chloroleuca]|uniref:Uncharacterized protein n=1 Tax=Clonostachys chloroleuca TaxID=1926264 RepID=A0AA35LSI7_9HYPO|nr:unnamed protein product [Clonostachys chloroleuca]
MKPPNYSSQRQLVCGLGQHRSYVVFIDTIMDSSWRALESDRTCRRGAHEYTPYSNMNSKRTSRRSSRISIQISTTYDSRFDRLLTDSKFHPCTKSDERPPAFQSTIKALAQGR